MEKDSKEGPRFVVKKWCGAPVLRWLLVVAAAARPEAWRLSACRSPGQERRDVLVLGHLHWCARPPACPPAASHSLVPTAPALRTGTPRVEVPRDSRTPQIRAPFAEISCTSRVSRPKPVRRCLLRACCSRLCRQMPPATMGLTPRPHASRKHPCATTKTPHCRPSPPTRHHCLRRRPGSRRRRRLQHRVGLLWARLPPRLHLALAEDALGLPAVQPRVGVCEDREDRDLRQPRLSARAARWPGTVLSEVTGVSEVF